MILGLPGRTVTLEQGDEFVEQIRGVVGGAGGRLRVVLHGEGAAGEQLDALHGAVVGADVTDPRAAEVGVELLPPASPSSAKPWFCEVIETLPVAWSTTGMLMPPRCPNFIL